MSGLHSSINLHVANNFFDMKTNKSYANHDMYLNSVGNHEERIKNLHFIYAAVSRAVIRASNLL